MYCKYCGNKIDELISRCSWEWVNLDGKNSFKVTGPNGNNIFLLAYKEMDHYMTSTPDETNLDRNYSLVLNFAKWNDKVEPEKMHGLRDMGHLVRPVSD